MMRGAAKPIMFTSGLSDVPSAARLRHRDGADHQGRRIAHLAAAPEIAEGVFLDFSPACN
jgi:hypothetical protein